MKKNVLKMNTLTLIIKFAKNVNKKDVYSVLIKILVLNAKKNSCLYKINVLRKCLVIPDIIKIKMIINVLNVKILVLNVIIPINVLNVLKAITKNQKVMNLTV